MKSKYLECVACGNRTMIQRKDSKDRPAGHVKHMWCPRCKARRPHIELDEFKTSFEESTDYDAALLRAYEKGINELEDD